MQALPILETVKGAFIVVFLNLASLARVAAIPLGLAVVLTVLLRLAAFAGVGVTVLNLASLILFLGMLAAMVPFMTAWHRFTLMVAEAVIPDLGIRWGRGESFYLVFWLGFAVAWAICLIFATVIAELVGGGIGGLLALLLSVAVLFLFVRFAFVFPAIAAGEDANPLHAWRQTAPGHLALFLIMLLVALPFSVLGLPLAWFGGQASAPALAILFGVLLTILFFFLAAVFVSALSLAYRTLTGFRIR